MKTHELKILPEYFRAVWNGIKTFEIRRDDRNFQVGDKVILKEFDSVKGEYTGSGLVARITYITDYAQKDGYVVFGIKRLEE